MKKAGPIGVYETFVPGAKIGQLYKFYIIGNAHGEEHLQSRSLCQ